MSIDVGERLRFVRARNKISQRELAKRSGVTLKSVAPNGEPSRPNPVITSSKISRMPCLVQMARSFSR